MATLRLTTPLASSQPATVDPTNEKIRTHTITHLTSLLHKSSGTKDLTQIHTQLLKSNTIHHPLLFPHLLSLYSQFDTHSTLQLFSHSSIGDDPFRPNSHTLLPVLKACAAILAVWEGSQIHGHAIKCGFVGDVYFGNCLMKMYFGFRQARDARMVFDRMSERNVVTWNCIIGGYAELRLWEEVVSLFRAMVGEAVVKPNSVTLVRVITACCRLGDVEAGEWVHRHVVENGVHLCLNLGNALVNMYAKFGVMEEAQRVFDEMVEHDVVSWTTLVSGYARDGALELARTFFDEMQVRNGVAWNAMIAGYVLNGCFQEAILLYEKMLVHGVKTDKATMISVLSACARSSCVFTGKVIHGYISKVGIKMTIDLLNSILGMYSKCGDMNSAELLFKRMGFKNEISWTLMIVGYINFGAKEIALDLFDKMPQKDVASWNALITALAQCNYFNEALYIFEHMQRMKVTPNFLTLTSTLSACTRAGALELGKWVHAYIERNNIKMDVQLSSSLIDMYAKCGCIELSLHVFDKMLQKDLLSWSTMIGGLAMHGKSKLALEFFKQMEGYGIKPDAITFVGVLSACSHAGLLEEGKYYFNLMTKTYNISPIAEHYGCMVDLFSRLGLLTEAKNFIDRIDISSNEEAIWGALLGACKLHGNVELAEYAASRLEGLNPVNSGPYVLLSNVYAKASKWEEVGKLRSIMKGKRIEKVPGCSSIEVNGTVHEFFAGDDSSHQEYEDICIILDGREKLMDAR